MSRPTLDSALLLLFSLTGLSPSLAGLSRAILLKVAVISAVRTPQCTHYGLGSSGFARRYSRNHYCFLFLRLLRCFSSPGLPRALRGAAEAAGCPIRKSMLMRVFAPGHGLSQLVTSFFASESQGILHVPFSPFLFFLENFVTLFFAFT